MSDYVADLQATERRRAIERSEAAAQARETEQREKEAAWAEFEIDHSPNTFNISRGQKLFQPMDANRQILDEYIAKNNLRYTAANLEQAFEACFHQLAHIDPRRDYTAKTRDEQGNRQPVPQNKLSIRSQLQRNPIPVEIGPAEIKAASPSQIRMWIRKFGSEALNRRLNGGN